MTQSTTPDTQKIRNLRQTIGANIHARRLHRKMTLVKLSRLTNFTINRLDMFEMGKDQIELQHLFKIAIALKCRITNLLKE